MQVNKILDVKYLSFTLSNKLFWNTHKLEIINKAKISPDGLQRLCRKKKLGMQLKNITLNIYRDSETHIHLLVKRTNLATARINLHKQVVKISIRMYNKGMRIYR